MAKIPSTMRSLVAPTKCKPEGYALQQLPVPTISLPTHVLLRVHAAAMNTGELQAAAGKFGKLYKAEYPLKIGIEGAGVVVAAGSAVKNLKIGDEVYGLYVDKPMFRMPPPGLASDYALVEERFLLHKPKSLPFESAASLAGLTTTSYQALRRGLQLMGVESLEGKTVYIPAGLSSTGSVAAQVAKNVFGASRIITTVSTAKLPLVEEYLPGIYDQVIDYTKQKPADVVPRGSVDLMYNTQWTTMDEGIPLINPTTGVLMSITSIPSKETAREIFGADKFPWWMGVVLDLAQLSYRWKLWGTKIKYEMLSGSPNIREDLERAGEIVSLGKVKSVVKTVDFEDMPAVRTACDHVVTGKGGIGKVVIKIA